MVRSINQVVRAESRPCPASDGLQVLCKESRQDGQQQARWPHPAHWLAPCNQQARRGSEMTVRPQMRRIKGREIDPYYGVYPPDQRQVFYPSVYPWGLRRADLHLDELGGRRHLGLVGLRCACRSAACHYCGSRLPMGSLQLGHALCGWLLGWVASAWGGRAVLDLGLPRLEYE